MCLVLVAPACVAARGAEPPAHAPSVKKVATEAASRFGHVVFAQLGGLDGDAASVITIVRTPYGQTRSMDVRVHRVTGKWAFQRYASTGGQPVDGPIRISRVAWRVLNDHRITLTDSARWDIRRGDITEHLLFALESLAQKAPFAVTALKTGHPTDVFGTHHLSAHAVGQAADIYKIAGARVIDAKNDMRVEQLVSSLFADLYVSRIGSPWDLGPRSFEDSVHADHVHIAVH